MSEPSRTENNEPALLSLTCVVYILRQSSSRWTWLTAARWLLLLISLHRPLYELRGLLIWSTSDLHCKVGVSDVEHVIECVNHTLIKKTNLFRGMEGEESPSVSIMTHVRPTSFCRPVSQLTLRQPLGSMTAQRWINHCGTYKKCCDAGVRCASIDSTSHLNITAALVYISIVTMNPTAVLMWKSRSS